MFDFFSRKKNKGKTFDPKKQVDSLTELSPPSGLVYLSKDNAEDEELGKVFFLRRDKKLYSEGANLYLTTPDNLKIAKDQNLNTKMVSLQFFHRRVPHRLACRVIGRCRILPEIAEALDFHAKAAYKLAPVGALKKEDKRQYVRYTLKNYGDSRIPLTTHVTFEAFLRSTNKEFPSEGAPPVLLTDMQANDFIESDYQGPFTTHARRDQSIPRYYAQTATARALFRSVQNSKRQLRRHGKKERYRTSFRGNQRFGARNGIPARCALLKEISKGGHKKRGGKPVQTPPGREDSELL